MQQINIRFKVQEKDDGEWGFYIITDEGQWCMRSFKQCPRPQTTERIIEVAKQVVKAAISALQSSIDNTRITVNTNVITVPQ